LKDLPIAREAAASANFEFFPRREQKKSAGGSPPAEDIVASQVF